MGEQLDLLGPLATSNARIARDVADVGRAGRDAGMQRAADHADAVVGDWQTRAGRILAEFLDMHGADPFTCPDVRIYAAALDFPVPPTARAWGAVINRARRAGLIVPTGRFRSYGDATTHTTDVREWRAA